MKKIVKSFLKKSKGKPSELSEHDRMLYDYGNKVKWVDVKLHLTHSEVEEFFGERCNSYEPSCSICKNWIQWDEKGTATISLLRNEVIELLRQ